jgi:hypothetical protein
VSEHRKAYADDFGNKRDALRRGKRCLPGENFKKYSPIAWSDPCRAAKGFGGARVMEIIDRYDTNTYRAVYTVQFADVIYVLHAFQKKSKRGIATPQKDLDLIRRRLMEAQRLDRQRSN